MGTFSYSEDKWSNFKEHLYCATCILQFQKIYISQVRIEIKINTGMILIGVKIISWKYYQIFLAKDLNLVFENLF